MATQTAPKSIKLTYDKANRRFTKMVKGQRWHSAKGLADTPANRKKAETDFRQWLETIPRNHRPSLLERLYAKPADNLDAKIRKLEAKQAQQCQEFQKFLKPELIASGGLWGEAMVAGWQLFETMNQVATLTIQATKPAKPYAALWGVCPELVNLWDGSQTGYEMKLTELIDLCDNLSLVAAQLADKFGGTATVGDLANLTDDEVDFIEY